MSAIDDKIEEMTRRIGNVELHFCEKDGKTEHRWERVISGGTTDYKSYDQYNYELKCLNCGRLDRIFYHRIFD